MYEYELRYFYVQPVYFIIFFAIVFTCVYLCDVQVDSSRKLCSLLMTDDDAGHMTCMDDSPCLLVEVSWATNAT